MEPSPNVTISLTRARLELPKIVEWVRSSYWGGWQSEEQIRRAIHNSTVFGAYSITTGAQLGFARVVSDHSSNSMITDVYVEDVHRRQGIGRRLMATVVEHASVAKTICVIRTRVPEFYSRFNFVPIGGDAMQRIPTGL